MDRILDFVWLIPVIPLAASGVIALQRRTRRKLASNLACGAMAAACVIALCCFAATLTSHHHNGAPLRGAWRQQDPAREESTWLYVSNFSWFPSGGTFEEGAFHPSYVQMGFIVDPLTAAMLVMVTFVGLMIFIYSTGYMGEDWNYTRFFCFLALFAAAMLMLVIANNILLLFMSWEVVGVCSYLLIGFWYHKPSAAEACKKAFVVTRIGDVGFFLGLLALYLKFGTLNLYSDAGQGGVLDPASLAAMAHAVKLPVVGAVAFSTVAGLGLFLGAMGKSAQFPLHVWLPDAMEGPTSVSALIHAATMVAAGVFMVARMFPVMEVGAVYEGGHLHHLSTAMQTILWIGAITAIFAASIGVAQNDIKRILAYSTVSQLGFMMMGLGAGGFVAGTFHLLTHAFFKALLFLGSGSVIHGCHGEQDVMRMGGLSKAMPTTYRTYLLGTLALAGIPPFAGFWSKDEILLDAFSIAKPVWLIGTAAAFLTAFYMFRQICLVFWGEQRDTHYHAHESPGSMTWPLRILAFFAVTLGLLGTPWHNAYHHYMAEARAAHPPSFLVMGGSIAVAAFGIVLAVSIYGRRGAVRAYRSADGETRYLDPLELTLGPLFRLLKNKYYVDEIYEATAVRASWVAAAIVFAFDRYVIDGALHAIGYTALGFSWFYQWIDNFFINGGFDRGCDAVRGTGGILRLSQGGKIQNYFFYASAGAVCLYVAYLAI